MGVMQNISISFLITRKCFIIICNKFKSNDKYSYIYKKIPY